MTKKLEINKIDPDMLVKLLTELGLKGDIEEMILSDIDKGFELNEDGSIDIVKYSAWLVINSGKTKRNG